MNKINPEKLKEHKQHGDILLPVALYPVIHQNAGQILPYHWHNEFEFIYMSKGEAIFAVDDETLPLKAGECIFVNGGQIHSAFTDTSPTAYFSIVFSAELLAVSTDACHRFFKDIRAGRFRLHSHYRPNAPEYREIIAEVKNLIKELTDRSFSYELAIKSCLFSIFVNIFRNHLYSEITEPQISTLYTRKQETLKKIMGYIYNNYNKKIKLTDISSSVSLTPQYLCKFFKEMTHMKIVDYINHYRIETAGTLLRISALSITDIALECGFDNLSYFNRVFKKQTGCTPGEFRSHIS